MRIHSIVLLSLGCLTAQAGGLRAAVAVSLKPSFPAPGFVGDTVVWQATVSDSAPGTLWCRFRVRPPGGVFQTVVDFGPQTSFQWTPVEYEGRFEVEVSARNRDTGEERRTSEFYDVLSRVRDGPAPVVSPTLHPLVFLYSAPECAPGGRMRVEFESRRGDRVATPAKPCVAGRSMNFLLAGMRSEAEYTVRHIVETPAGDVPGPSLTLTPLPFAYTFFAYRLMTPPAPAATLPVLLQSTTLGGRAVATDLEGNLLWFYREELTFLTRPLAGGTILGIFQQPSSDSSYQVVREFDLTGTTVRETNAARVSEQLQAMGKAPVTAFHHEASPLADGRVVVLAATERILSGVQGPGPVNVLGEMVVVLDRNFQVEWAWDSFDHIDPARAALQGETCAPGGGGCPPFYLSAQANDWLHANSVRYTPDGNLVMSIRHQDWVIKIDYADGQGSGLILWRLGRYGDFTIESDDPDPWFSHQHDATILPGPDRLLTLFDNGNARFVRDSTAKSRGQMYKLDEQNRVARLVYNLDLGLYAPAVGSAQRLPNGNFHFDIGFLGGGVLSRSVETDAAGRVVYDLEADGAAYRTFRMGSLYVP
jgi:arylsulfate sulfotransferase